MLWFERPPDSRRTLENRLNQNELSEIGADGEPGIAHLANEIGLACYQSNNLLLTKTDFTQAL